MAQVLSPLIRVICKNFNFQEMFQMTIYNQVAYGKIGLLFSITLEIWSVLLSVENRLGPSFFMVPPSGN